MDTIIYVKKIELTPSVFNAINTVLSDKNPQHTIMRTTPKVFTVPTGQQSQHIDTAFLGEILRHIAICMMDTRVQHGLGPKENMEKNVEMPLRDSFLVLSS